MTTSPPRNFDVALVDANVLFAHHPRNVLVTLASERVFDMRWTAPIEREWINALLRERPQLLESAVRTTAARMNKALPAAAVEDFLGLAVYFPKTDAKDRHVAAAAAKCAPSILVTYNIRDFDRNELASRNVALMDPDTFLCRQFDADAEVVFAGTEKAFGFLKRPDGRPTWSEYVELLGSRYSLSEFAERLRSLGPGIDLDGPESGSDRSP